MSVPLYIVDAFAKKPYTGNPASVCLLLDDTKSNEMSTDDYLRISSEMNHSETCFIEYLPKSHPKYGTPNHYGLRWFTPTVEVKLCGHGTLASAHTLFNELKIEGDKIIFHPLSGELVVEQKEGVLLLDFPQGNPQPIHLEEAIQQSMMDAFALDTNVVERVSFCGFVLFPVAPDQ